MPESLTSNATISRAIEKARFFVPEIPPASKAKGIMGEYQYMPWLKGPTALQVAESAALRYRLVKAAKCPTEQFRDDLRASTRKQTDDFNKTWFTHESEKIETPAQYQRTEETNTVLIKGQKYNLADMVKTGELVPVTGRTKIEGAGRFTVVTQREWSGEFKIRTEVEQPAAAPPLQSGKRSTKELSMRGAVAISDSCHYMAKKHGGFSTFLTLTFDSEARRRVREEVTVGPCTEIKYLKRKYGVVIKPKTDHKDAGEVLYFSSIQTETSRFFDGIQKMYQRGWQAKTDFQTIKMPANEHKLKYCWVAENPKNSLGEDNPHLHVLIDWRVPYQVFDAWAKRIERIWGQGVAHLEKIKSPEMAGAYMAKAAGYLTKAQGATDQGEIRGNRYGISEDARAPLWALVGRYELGIMGHLIADVYDFFGFKYGPKFKARRKLNGALDGAKSKAADMKKEGVKQSPSDLKRRAKIGQKLQKVRAEINELPAVSSKYQIVVKSKAAFDEFWNWATNAEKGEKCEWLPTITKDETWSPDVRPSSLWYGEYMNRIGDRRRNFFYEVGAKWWKKIDFQSVHCRDEEIETFENEYTEYLGFLKT